MKDNFPNSMLSELMKLTKDVAKYANIGDKEWQVLRLFYNEKYKARRDIIPKFQIFGTLCDGKLEEGWHNIMTRTETALHNLIQAGWIEVVKLSAVGILAQAKVGSAGETFRLTADGLEKLQQVHPSIALRLRGWVAVMPPWLVMTGSIAGCVSAIWKIIELLSPLIWRVT